jgi:hypothetical protein
MKPITQSVYRNIIERFCRETDKQGKEYGDLSAAGIQREHIIQIDGRESRQTGQR